MFVDLPLSQLRDYRPEPPVAPDFDGFWTDTLTAFAEHIEDTNPRTEENR